MHSHLSELFAISAIDLTCHRHTYHILSSIFQSVLTAVILRVSRVSVGHPAFQDWRASRCASDNQLPWKIITCRKIIGFCGWLIVWSLPQGPPGTAGYPGTMGPPGLPVSSGLIIKDKRITASWQLPRGYTLLTLIHCSCEFVRDWRVNVAVQEAVDRKENR